MKTIRSLFTLVTLQLFTCLSLRYVQQVTFPGSKIVQPFLTTKPTGEGIGAGLLLSYKIIAKGHEGNLQVETEKDEYAEFIISMPLRNLVVAEQAAV